MLAVLPLVGCSIDVQKDDHGRKADVDIRAFGNAVKVHTDVSADGTGLAVYPGARPSRRHDRAESANVDVRSWFGVSVQVVAAKFESDDDPEHVRVFYREQLAQYGPVVECRGHVSFRRFDGARRPVCRGGGRTEELKLVTGTDGNQRIVTIEPAGDGTEFALVYVNNES